MQIGTQLTVADSSFHRDRAGFRVQGDHAVHLAKREEVMRAVGDTVEAMARAQRLDLAVLSDQLLNLFDRLWLVQLVGTVLVIARPVFELFLCAPGPPR